ncbi:thiamine monophosphate kinase [uncultured Gammaproteobacteria bacterium]
MPSLGEFDRIARIFRPLTVGCPAALDLTDDAAVLTPPPGRDLVITTDAMVGGVHFLPEDSPADVAAKLLRVNLSDLAAMGAEPLGYTLVTALPRTLGEVWLEAFAEGLLHDQRRYGIALLGGDSVSTSGPITLSVTALGSVVSGRALTRRSRDPSAALFVTGTIGDAALGLAIALERLDDVTDSARGVLLGRLRRPEPRLTVAAGLYELALAAIDVSDGLVADLGHLCRVSGCAAVIEAARVPLSASAREILDGQPELLTAMITGGDDYELLFAAPASHRSALAALARAVGVPITEIGRLLPGPPGQVTVTGADGVPLRLARQGWTHF